MTSLNAHCGPVDFLVALSSSLSPDLLKRDSMVEGHDSACGLEGRSESSSQESLQQPSISTQVDGKGKGRGGMLLQYRLRSTSGLPGRPLTARGDEASDSSLESLEHSMEDGSIYELSDDPDMWVRGRPCERERVRRDRVTSVAVISGGKGFRRLREGSVATTAESTLMIWQLPLTVWFKIVFKKLWKVHFDNLLYPYCMSFHTWMTFFWINVLITLLSAVTMNESFKKETKVVIKLAHPPRLSSYSKFIWWTVHLMFKRLFLWSFSSLENRFMNKSFRPIL